MLVIGVTGHRFLAEVGKLQAGIDQALIRIDQRYPGQPWMVISCLAEGADRLVVERVLAFRAPARLVVLLPLPVEAYQTDFSSPESRTEFARLLGSASQVIRLRRSTSREKAYAAAGEYLLEHANVLIALWDGRSAQGRGGTGDIMTIARRKGLPIAWVHAGNRMPGSQEPVSLGEEQGCLTLERFD